MNHESKTQADSAGEAKTGRAETHTRTSTIWLDGDGIVRIIANAGSVQGRADAEENMEAIKKVGLGRRRPILVDISKVKSVDAEARAVYSGPMSAEISLASALVVNSAIGRLIGNFFIGLNKPAAPLRLVTSEREGLAWLRTFAGKAD
jgi:hypothetical protein